MPTDELQPPPDDASLPSLGAAYFDELYERSPEGDPWNFAQSPYEAAKYAETLARLPRPRYRSGLEVGCSIGVLTHHLAPRLDRLLAVDLSLQALDQARHRCANQPEVEFAQENLIESVPSGPFDLIILSEVAYYWTPTDFARIWHALVANLASGGQIILVHWRAQVPDYPQTGDQVHASACALATEAGMLRRDEWVEARYRIDVWERGEFHPHADSVDRDDRMMQRS